MTDTLTPEELDELEALEKQVSDASFTDEWLSTCSLVVNQLFGTSKFRALIAAARERDELQSQLDDLVDTHVHVASERKAAEARAEDAVRLVWGFSRRAIYQVNAKEWRLSIPHDLRVAGVPSKCRLGEGAEPELTTEARAAIDKARGN